MAAWNIIVRLVWKGRLRQELLRIEGCAACFQDGGVRGRVRQSFHEEEWPARLMVEMLDDFKAPSLRLC